MDSKIIYGLAVGAVLLSLGFPAQAQQPKKVPRIGYLAASSATDTARIDAFRRGLRELGYEEGKNIVIEHRYQRENAIASQRLRPSWYVSR